ncbi:MAG: hypothetical protein LH610_00760 [Sphingomonas bacterium]|nr:hypothetical protein [Sphingomonas bacterium]
MSSAKALISPLDGFLEPMIGVPAWGVKRGHGSFLTFEFGEPSLVVEERQSAEKGLRRSTYVQGQSHLWIYCCHWRAMQDDQQLARSEDTNDLMDRATATLYGQKLMAVSVGAKTGHSRFTFDLGGSLETWPYGDDRTDEQWIVHRGAEAFAYRADGLYSHGPGDKTPELERWLPLA